GRCWEDNSWDWVYLPKQRGAGVGDRNCSWSRHEKAFGKNPLVLLLLPNQDHYQVEPHRRSSGPPSASDASRSNHQADSYDFWRTRQDPRYGTPPVAPM